jgi:hypothetical protein
VNENEQRESMAGRSIRVGVDAPDLAALELAALDSAREFFGPDVRLEVVRDYQVHDMKSRNDPARRWMASITVREIP